MKKLLSIILVASLIISLCACGSPSGNTSKAKEIKPGVVQVNNCTIEITDCKVKLPPFTGIFEAHIYINFTNNSQNSWSLQDLVTIKAFQQGAALTQNTLSNFTVMSSDEVLSGYTVKTGVTFFTNNVDSPILIQIIVGNQTVSEITFTNYDVSIG